MKKIIVVAIVCIFILAGALKAFAQMTFTEVAESLGVAEPGWGVAWGDYNNDGYLDIYTTSGYGSGGAAPNHLFRNNGPPDYNFTDVADSLGVTDSTSGTACCWGDYNNDGYLDLFVACYPGPVYLYHNNGPPDYNFSNVAQEVGMGIGGQCWGAAWADYNNDGNLDIYTGSYRAGCNHLFLNSGPPDYTFTDVAQFLGVDQGDSRAQGLAWADMDNDGDMDLYVGNWARPASLFRNSGSPNYTFTEVATSYGVDNVDFGIYVRSAGGVAWGDFDNDGLLDLYLGRYYPDEPDRLYWNLGGYFPEMAFQLGIDDTGTGLSMEWGDYDNDCDIDLCVVSPPHLYRNNGGLNGFTEVSDSVGIIYPGMDGIAWGDYNNDGALDLYITQRSVTGRLYRNNGSANHWLVVKLVGTISNKSAIGARVTVSCGAIQQIREVSGGSGQCCQNSLPVEFGLGASELVDSIEIKWPSGIVTTLYSINADTILTIIEETIGIDDEITLPKNFSLSQNYPNPMRSSTTICFSIPKNARDARIEIYNVRGQLIKQFKINPECFREKINEVLWDGTDYNNQKVAIGIYLYRLCTKVKCSAGREADNKTITKKLLLLR